jgi:hypothetical protein
MFLRQCQQGLCQLDANLRGQFTLSVLPVALIFYCKLEPLHKGGAYGNTLKSERLAAFRWRERKSMLASRDNAFLQSGNNKDSIGDMQRVGTPRATTGSYASNGLPSPPETRGTSGPPAAAAAPLAAMRRWLASSMPESSAAAHQTLHLARPPAPVQAAATRALPEHI